MNADHVDPAKEIQVKPWAERVMLGIESSCDDTSIAILRGSEVLSQFTAAQHIHAQYGGVVPEFASRAHQVHIVPVLEGALSQAGCTLQDLDGVAYTRGPGLQGSLLVGSAFARSLGWSLGLPLYPVHHMRAHVVAHWMADAAPNPTSPMLALTVSGGHTQLLDVASPWDMRVMGTTLDDAAGEAFDKVAKMLGLDYPGGPIVDRMAKDGNPNAFAFTAPKVAAHDFSFSGLKTSVLRVLEKELAGAESPRMHLCRTCVPRPRAPLSPSWSKNWKPLHCKWAGRPSPFKGGSAPIQACVRRCWTWAANTGGQCTFPPFVIARTMVP